MGRHRRRLDAVLFLLATEGRIVRARPRGTWISSQYEWTSLRTWVDPLPSLTPADARAALLRRWLRTYGPATLRDLTWWAGWTQAHGRAALAAIDAVEVELDDGVGFVLPDDVAPVRAPAAMGRAAPRPRPDDDGLEGARLVPRCARGRACSTATGTRAPRCGPTGASSAGGGSAATASSRPSCSSRSTTRPRVPSRARSTALTEWLAGTVVTPRFRTPLEKEIAAR